MIDLGSVDFYIGIPSISKSKLESYSKELFDKWDKKLTYELNLNDFSISLEVEEGSISGKAKVTTALAALYIGIGQYASFIDGIQTIKRQVSACSNYLSDEAQYPYRSNNISYKVNKKGGALGQIEKLFIKVQKNELTVDEAVIKAKEILGEETNTSPEFIIDLKKSLEDTPRMLEQMDFDLPLELLEMQNIEDSIPHQKRKVKIQKDAILHNRIQIWRESKNGKRKILVTQI